MLGKAFVQFFPSWCCQRLKVLNVFKFENLGLVRNKSWLHSESNGVRVIVRVNLTLILTLTVKSAFNQREHISLYNWTLFLLQGEKGQASSSLQGIKGEPGSPGLPGLMGPKVHLGLHIYRLYMNRNWSPCAPCFFYRVTKENMERR